MTTGFAGLLHPADGLRLDRVLADVGPVVFDAQPRTVRNEDRSCLVDRPELVGVVVVDRRVVDVLYLRRDESEFLY